MTLAEIIRQLEETQTALLDPFLALPEHGWNPERLAYQRGARDAYKKVIDALKEIST